MTIVRYYACPFCGRSHEIGYALGKGEYMKLDEPSDLGTVQMRQAMGRAKGFKTISEEPARNLLSDPMILQITNAMVDMSGGILWGCLEEKLFPPLHPPLIVTKYLALVNQTEDHDAEDGIRMKLDDSHQNTLSLIGELKKEREERDALAFEVEDLQRQIVEQRATIQTYENASLK